MIIIPLNFSLSSVVELSASVVKTVDERPTGGLRNFLVLPHRTKQLGIVESRE